MSSIKPPLLHWLLALLFVSIWSSASAEVSSDKPFAQKRIVLQISDSDPFKQTLVLNVAGNLVKHYGPDAVDIEIVAFSRGLRLLLADNTNVDRIDRLVNDSGVRFAACDNTHAKFTKALGHEPPLNPHAVHVSAGVVRIIDLVEQGYTLVKP